MKNNSTNAIQFTKTVQIYTDGACSGNPGIGGWGSILFVDDYRKEFSGYNPSTTNNRMELTAVIEAIKRLRFPCKILIYSDSAYVVNAFLNNWITSWKANGWKKSDNKDVLNVDLWKELDVLLSQHSYRFIKVKGHAANPDNERCDELARTAIIQCRNSII